MSELRRARVTAVRSEAEDVLAFDLVPADGRPFAPFVPGDHIDVLTPDGLLRQYSLCGERRRSGEVYTIAVKREAFGRGGSVAMHSSVARGTILAIGEPRSHFVLAPDLERAIFIAGGIGITPIVPMIHALSDDDRDWVLHFCARSRRQAAFYDALEALGPGRVHGYFSDTPGGRLDVAGLLRKHEPGTHLYCCGPERLMSAVAQAAGHWPQSQVHFEWFKAPAVATGENTAFEVELGRSGGVLSVPPDRSILEVVHEAGIDVPCACREGVCGTCETRVISGEPDHRDALLSAEERVANKTMMICVSRSKKRRLVLDL